MKKVLFFMLAASAALNVYLINVEVVVKDELDQEYAPRSSKDKVTLAQSALKKEDESECAPRVVEKIVEKIVYRERSAASEDEERSVSDALEEIAQSDLAQLSKAEVQAVYQGLQDDWKERSKTFFEYDLGLTSEQQTEYEKLKRAMESEITAMLLQGEDSEMQNEGRALRSEEMIEMGKIHQRYEELLKGVFGPSAYHEYISFREAYNRKVAQENSGLFSVQF